MALWAQTRPERQRETAQPPCARVQKCHCSRLEPTGAGPETGAGQRQGAGGSQAREWGADPRQENKARHRKEADRRASCSPSGIPGPVPGSWRGPGHRESEQQRCRPETGAGPVRADGAAYQTETFDFGRPSEPSRFIWRLLRVQGRTRGRSVLNPECVREPPGKNKTRRLPGPAAVGRARESTRTVQTFRTQNFRTDFPVRRSLRLKLTDTTIERSNFVVLPHRMPD